MRISDEIFKRLAEAYRKIRNTCRYLVSNLFDFDPGQHAVAEADLDDLDRYALAHHRQLVARVLEAYESYQFHMVYHELTQYCAADLSSFYLDVLKDRLYCDPPAGRRRRSAQTVLHRILGDVTRLMVPVLPFTAEEVWGYVPGQRPEFVHEAVFPAREAWDEGVLQRFQGPLLSARDEALKSLEASRAAKVIASGLEARLEVRGNEDALAPLAAYESRGSGFPGNLANLFIVSRVDLIPAEGPLTFAVSRAAGSKCERCWTYSPRVGSLSAHPGVCERCAEVLEERS
jgi:isoleucyl-tRNA synthetase